MRADAVPEKDWADEHRDCLSRGLFPSHTDPRGPL